MEETFYHYQYVKLYALKSRKVTEKKAEAINQRMKFVMTGDQSYIDEKQVQSSKTTHKKRK